MNKLKKPVYVTQPALPPLEEFTGLLKQIWDTKILTNNGPFHKQFEQALTDYLGVNYISLFSNGTLALITALQALRITGEVITTPFSFVATTHSLWWNNIKPVFADETTVIAPGINAKMNELQSAYGLLQLKYVDGCIAKRKKIAAIYREQLKEINGISFLEDIEGIDHAYSYFPILVDKEKFGTTRDELYEELKKHNIFTRRYFCPLISQFPTYRGLPSSKQENLPIATKVAEQVLCLPIFPDLQDSSIAYICSLLSNT